MRYLYVVFYIFLIMSAVSCKKASDARYSSSDEPGIYNEESARDKKSTGGTVSSPDSSGEEIPQAQLKRIKQGNLDLESADLVVAEKKIKDIVFSYSGYVASLSSSLSSLYMTVKVPADRFDRCVDDLKETGKVKSCKLLEEEVSKKYYDLEKRIKNKQILLERYRSYLSRAKDIDELLKLERTVNDLVTEIEMLEGSFYDLNSLISYSTLTITVSLPVVQKIESKFPSFKRGFSNLFFGFVDFIYGLFFFILYILVFGTPLVLTGWLFYFLLIGRVGLFRRLYVKFKDNYGSRGKTEGDIVEPKK